MRPQSALTAVAALAVACLVPSAASAQDVARHSSGPSPVAGSGAPAGAAIAQIRAANARGTVEPRGAAFLNAAAIYPYSEGAIYRAYAAPERVTDIALQPGESLVAVASGDTVRWVIGDTVSGAGTARRAHVLVKPFSAGLATNLVIMTDRRTYHVALTSSTGPAQTAISWSYPEDALLAIQRAQAAAEAIAPAATGFDVERLNFAYAISGDRPAWRPLRAFDDGQQTFIEFAPSLAVGEAPPLFLVDRQGEAQLVNYRVRGRFYVVDRLFDAAELRLGTKRQQIVRIARSEATAFSRHRRGS